MNKGSIVLVSLAAGLIALPQVATATPTASLKPPENYVKLRKFADKNRVSPGEMLTYTTTFENVGNKPVTQVVLNDAIPNYTEYVSASCMPNVPVSLGSCTVIAPPIGAGNPHQVKWTFSQSLQPGVKGFVTLVVRVSRPAI